MKIPPRVVVEKVLVYVQIVTFVRRTYLEFFPFLKDPSSAKEEDYTKLRLCYFGYFKRDFTRTIFFIFPHLVVNCGEPTNPFFNAFPIFDIDKLVSIDLKGIERKYVPKSIFEAGKLNRLEHLHLSDTQQFTGTKWTALPNLRYLNFHGINSFTDTFFQKNELPKLRALRIFHTNQLLGNGWNVKFEHSLREIHLSFCKIGDELFQNHHFPNLTKFSIGGCNNITGVNWKPINNLVTLSIFHYQRFNDDFFRFLNFSKLERFFLEDLNGFSGLWNQTFPKLFNFQLVNVGVNDSLFTSNKYPVLESLSSFCGLEGWTGENWNEFPKMDELSLSKSFPNIDGIKNLCPDECEFNLY